MRNVQLILAVVLAVFGMVMLTASFFTPPIGEISPSVLTALGEIFTFAGSIIGVDYHYRNK